MQSLQTQWQANTNIFPLMNSLQLLHFHIKAPTCALLPVGLRFPFISPIFKGGGSSVDTHQMVAPFYIKNTISSQCLHVGWPMPRVSFWKKCPLIYLTELQGSFLKCDTGDERRTVKNDTSIVLEVCIWSGKQSVLSSWNLDPLFAHYQSYTAPVVMFTQLYYELQ